jgi:hypothetical protein
MHSNGRHFQNGRRQNRQNFNVLWLQWKLISRVITICRFCWRHFGNGGIVKMTLNSIFIIINQFLTSNEEQVISMLEFLIFTSFWRNSDSYEYKNKLARRGAQFVPIGMPTTCWNSAPPMETNMLSMRSWKLKRPRIQLRPHHFLTYTLNLTTVVNSVLKFMIKGITSILKS